VVILLREHFKSVDIGIYTYSALIAPIDVEARSLHQNGQADLPDELKSWWQ
jgi:hypothetical protein